METKGKVNRAVTIATNKRTKDIKHVLELRDEMIANKIDIILIKKYLDEQYENINQEYDKKIKKHKETELKKQIKLNKKEIMIKRTKAIEFLLKNKAYLEEKCFKPEYIKIYVERQYNEINQNYSTCPEHNIYNIDLEHVNFID
jgi:hypothetical protein